MTWWDEARGAAHHFDTWSAGAPWGTRVTCAQVSYDKVPEYEKHPSSADAHPSHPHPRHVRRYQSPRIPGQSFRPQQPTSVLTPAAQASELIASLQTAFAKYTDAEKQALIKKVSGCRGHAPRAGRKHRADWARRRTASSSSKSATTPRRP